MSQVDKNISAENAAWSFENIAEDFDQHVEKSVPLYCQGHDLVCYISDFFLPKDAIITELGISTGVLAKKVLDHHAGRNDIRYIGIDSVEGMVDKAKLRCQGDNRASFYVEDIVKYPLEKSAMIISYYTLQFIHPKYRQKIFNEIYQSLEWGGALLLFEKVRGPDARFQDIFIQVYNDYKLSKNFSEKEILNKTRSLKGVLEPFSTQGNLDLMKRAGFVDITTVMKWMCFEGFLAIK